MQDPFDQKKSSLLSEIGITDFNNPDASPKGTIDEKCFPIMQIINSDKDMVTTSSCSGRVSVFLEGIKDKEQLQIGAKGNEGRWIFVTHDSTDLPNWYQDVSFKYDDESLATDAHTRYILFKFEPLILHVKCRNLESANALYTAAMGCGYRESGIGTNNIVAIRISIKLDIPIGYLDPTTNELVSFVSKQYMETITKLSLDRFQENEKKLKNLENAITQMKLSRSVEKVEIETKEQRQERKRREGLARRESVLLQKEQKRKEKEAAEVAKRQATGEEANTK